MDRKVIAHVDTVNTGSYVVGVYIKPHRSSVMAPLIALIVVSVLARLAGRFGWTRTTTWADALRPGVAAMFVLTGVAHFVGPMRAEMVQMVPPLVGHGEFWVAFTGIAEICGAVGVLLAPTRRLAAAGLIVLLVAVFPANVYAIMNDIRLPGAPPTSLWFRTFEQLVFLAAVSLAGFGNPVRDEAERALATG